MDIKDLIGIEKPATRLIEVVSGGFANLFEPKRIIRKAKAETTGLIESAKLIQKTDFPDDVKRAMLKKVGLEIEAQENLDRITKLAIPHLSKESNPEAIQSDWLARFRDNCEFVRDQEIQSLWAKILAGESNHQGCVSKATLNILGNLSKVDANNFTALLSSCFQDGDGDYIPIILPEGMESNIYKELGFRPKNFRALEELGLIHYNGISGFGNNQFPNIVRLTYFDSIAQFKISDEEGFHRFEFGDITLSRAGQELVRFSGRKENSGLLSKIFELYSARGYKTEIVK
jgi:hypothetical protein